MKSDGKMTTLPLMSFSPMTTWPCFAKKKFTRPNYTNIWSKRPRNTKEPWKRLC